jgi:GDPmannose 4,6-dehydratase
VTRKIVKAAFRIAQGSPERLSLGSLDIHRDWGWAPEYVEAMWRILQHHEPDDFVIASGRSHSLQDFVVQAFAEVGLDWRRHVQHDPSLIRPLDIHHSRGCAEKAARTLGWTPAVDFKAIVARMIRAEREGPALTS